jgi:putative flippase GtrA
MTLFVRWLRFNAGGLYGFLLQLLLLTVLSRRLPLAAATAIAVEAAVIHNFVWHEHFTWKERHVRDMRSIAVRFVRFQLANGCISLAGNVLLTTYLHRALHMPPVWANVFAIGTCSVFNFVAGEWIVFKKTKKTYPEDRRMLFV